ncbi:DEAD/DEAH box helicase [Lysobacter sp. HA35]
MQLRPYQESAVDALWAYLRAADGNPALVLPTGAGKSPLMGAIAREAVERWQGRVGILAHVQELVQQNEGKLKAIWPEADVGVYAASLRRRDRFNRILVMQIQSVAGRATSLGHFDILLIDEAHRIPLKGDGQYLQFIRDCRRINPNLRVVGLTATPYRLQGAAVPVCGADNVLTEIAFEARIPDLIRGGYLSRLVSRAGELPNLAGVHTRGGEYVEAELAARMDDAGLIARTMDDLCVRAADRRAWIVFCVNVGHAEHVRDALQARGVASGLVHAGTAKADRESQIADFQSGRLRAMVNVNVLSEGFDAPHIDCVAMLRPTKSPGLYYQQVGRGLRLADGKADCLVLDYAGNVLEHGPVDEIKVRRARFEGDAATVQTARVKECGCGALLALGIRMCPECGHEFGSADPAHAERPVDAPVLSIDKPRRVTEHSVGGVSYARHSKPGKTPSLRVTYHCGLRQFHEWICVEHSGLARAKALRWWQTRADASCPRSVEEAIAASPHLRRPSVIVVDETDKFPEIKEHRFTEEAPALREQPRPAANAPSWLTNAMRKSA